MEENKSISKELKEKLFLQRKNGYTRIDEAEEKAVFNFAEDYKKFLDTAKTEREAVCEAVRILEENGFVEYKKQTRMLLPIKK